MANFNSKDADLIVKQCVEEVKAGLQYKQGRVEAWQDIEDQYYGKVKKSLKSRFNVPIPVLPGFVDTLHAKVDDPPQLQYESDKESEYIATQKAQALYQSDSSADDADWDSKDLLLKKSAILYGRAIAVYFAESKPKYKGNFVAVDVYDFYADPTGGSDLEEHRFMGRDGIFKDKEALLAGVANGLYDAGQVKKLLTDKDDNGDQLKITDGIHMNKANRSYALNLDNRTYNYAGQTLFKFIEAVTTWKGERYYCLFNYENAVAVRCQPLKDVFKSNLWPFISWATHPDPWNFWSKGPCDDIRPIAEVMRVLVNQELDNRQKKNWGQRAYDPEMFPNPAELEWRPDGLVAVKAGMTRVMPIQNGLYQFETPELQGTINLVDWLDQMVGRKSGVTPDAQGESEETKVGIYYGNMQQVADRLGLLNRHYKKFYAMLGRRHLWGAFEHLNKPQAVKIIGQDGVMWDEIKKREIGTDWQIRVTGGQAEQQQNALKQKQKAEGLVGVLSNPNLAPKLNPQWAIEESLKAAGYEDMDIKMALDTGSEPDKIVMSKAAQAIEDISAGKKVKPFRGANTAFIQKIIDFALDETDDDIDLFNRLMAYAQAHMPIAAQNAARKAIQVQSQMMQGAPPQPGMGPQDQQPGQQASLPNFSQPAANTPQGTQSASGLMTNINAPQNAQQLTAA